MLALFLGFINAIAFDPGFGVNGFNSPYYGGYVPAYNPVSSFSPFDLSSLNKPFSPFDSFRNFSSLFDSPLDTAAKYGAAKASGLPSYVYPSTFDSPLDTASKIGAAKAAGFSSLLGLNGWPF